MTQKSLALADDTLLPADPMVSMIERVAMDPKADLDKLERMLAMKERMDAEAQRRAYNDAMTTPQHRLRPAPGAALSRPLPVQQIEAPSS